MSKRLILVALLLSATVGAGCINAGSFNARKGGLLGKPLGAIDRALWGSDDDLRGQKEFPATDRAQLPAGATVGGCDANGYGCEHAHYVCKLDDRTQRITFAVEIFGRDEAVIDNRGYWDPAYNHLCAGRPEGVSENAIRWYAYHPHGRVLERRQ